MNNLLVFLSVCFLALEPGHSLWTYDAYVNIGWLELVEKDEGWQIKEVRELGNWNLPLRPGDLILTIDGQDATNIGPLSVAAQLQDALFRKVQVLIRRNSEKQRIEIFADENPPSVQTFYERYGIGIQITRREDPPGIIALGVVPGGPAQKVGIKKGDELVAVDGRDVTHVEVGRVSDLLLASQPGPVRLRIRRGIDEFEFELERVSTRQLFPSREPEPAGAKFPLHKRNQPAPAFSLPDLQGRPVSLSDFRGRWVLVNFWGTWCAPCHLEIPILNKWVKDYSGKLVVLGLDVDDEPEKLREFLSKTPLAYIVLIAGKREGQIAKAYNCNAVPWNVLVSPDGLVQYVEAGFLPTSSLEEYLRKSIISPGPEGSSFDP